MADKKSALEVALMPLVIAVVGFIGTSLITNQQEKNSIRLAEAQIESAQELAEADRQIKILQIFADNITNQNDESERLFALRLLEAIDGELAAKLANAVRAGAPEGSPTKQVAQEVADEASARAQLTPRVYIHIRKESVREAAHNIGSELKGNGYVIPGIERLVNIGPDKTELRYFRQHEEATAKAIAEHLSALSVYVVVSYIPGYETSRKIRENHFELWFGPNEPK
jgi:hypothetical protein